RTGGSRGDFAWHVPLLRTPGIIAHRAAVPVLLPAGSARPGLAIGRGRDGAQRRALVHGDVIGLVAFDLVLGIVRGAVAGVALPLEVVLVDFPDGAADAAGFGVPAD